MQLQMIDNVEHNTAAELVSSIKAANDVRIAVAFVSSDGLLQIMPSVQTALAAGAYVEFLVGMDVRATDPSAIKKLYDLTHETSQVSLLCFASRSASAIYHPKMYLMRDDHTATAIIGSSNLTRRGLTSNIEANVVIRDNVQAEIVSEIYSTYNRLKYHPDRVVPDDEFIALFAELCQHEKLRERRLAKDSELKKLKETFLGKANKLQRPKPTKADLVGWLELVYSALPEDRFTNREIYGYENKFKQHYPQNLNIRAKIRQQLQILHKLGFIEHIGTGIWRKVR
ncbi:MAG: phospholipase D-like domain-containing protein [Chloroflexota bacterium]